MKRSAAILLFLALVTLGASAQSIYSASSGRFSLTAGGLVSVFQPQLRQGDPNFSNHTSAENNFGPGVFVDLRLTHWVQLEAEARFLPFTRNGNVQGLAQDSEDTYLVGPRLPVHRFGKSTVYAKALFGVGVFPGANNSTVNVNQFPPYTVLAYGGGVDYKISKRLSLRAIDFEYQQWLGVANPNWTQQSSILPYGVSSGISYRIF